jgi:hypothetical protein
VKKNKQFKNISEENIASHSWQFGPTRISKIQIIKNIIAEDLI